MLRKITYLAFFIVLPCSFAHASTQPPDPGRIREAFAVSGDPKLELAAEALGDDGLIKLLDEIKHEQGNDGALKKILKHLK